MDKKHKELLLVQRANLVENLNMKKGLFTQLLCRKVIDQRMVRNIKNGKTEDDQAEELLDFLPKSETGAQTFDLFCEALIADSQGHIVKCYLKTEHSDEKNEGASTSSVAQVEESLTGTGTVVADCVQVREPVSADGDRVGPSRVNSSLVPQVAIQEEFQQQMYRRSIEPRSLQHTQSSPCFDQDSEHEARMLYQTSLRRPAAMAAMMENQMSNKLLYEKSTYRQSPSKLPVDRMHHSSSDSMLVKDCVNQRLFQGDMKSSNDLIHPSSAHSPSVFSVFSQKEIPSSPIKTGYQPIQRSFDFHHHLQDQNSVYNARFGSPNSKFSSPNSNFHRETESENENLMHPFVNRNLGDFERMKSESARHESIMQQSPYKYDALQSSPSKMIRQNSQHGVLEQDCMEMPRYIEVNNNGQEGTGRMMMSLPRHVMMSHVSPPDAQNEEFTRETTPVLRETPSMTIERTSGSVPRLARLDSVDTMHNRANSEKVEINVKRCREDVDTCNPTIVSKVPKLTPIPVLENRDNNIINIPVIEEPYRKPSMPAVVIETDSQLEKCQRSSLLGAMDDPEIDLTDGPINVNVELSTRQFYLAHYKQAYAMRRIPRGKALIMNVNEVVGKSARRGTDIDRDNLHNLLCQMHFDVTVYNDSDGLTALEMIQKLQDFSQNSAHATADCSVICILSHGEEGFVFGADGKKFELDAVFTLFDNTCCLNLRGKPKIFIIQACRGGALDRGVQYYPDEHDGSDARVRQVPSMSDMLICYPTQNGYYAWRNRDRGSWYVEALVQIFMKYARCEDVCTMLNRVNLLVSKKVSHCPNIDMDQMSQMSEYKSTLRMPHLYFFPGIGGCS